VFTEFQIHQRQFTSPWILIRCLSVCVDAAEKAREYEKTVKLFEYLTVGENIWHFSNSRWKWHIRLSMNLDFHLKDYYRAYNSCMTAFSDATIGLAHKLSIQDRARKLAKRLNVSFDEQIVTSEIEKVTITGNVIVKNLSDGRKHHFYISNPQGDIENCSVEDVALDYFQKGGYSEGYHSEERIWHTLFRLFFYDIIYSNDIPAVWNSKLQDDPLDVNFCTFYSNRKERFDARLQETKLLNIEEVKNRVESNYIIARGYGWSFSRIGWLKFNSGLQELQRFVSCCTVHLIHALFARLIKDFENVRSGFPDLTLWNVADKKLMVAEVKSPNDKLSSKQILWLNFFAEQGVRSVVCHVTAKNGRSLH